MRPKIFDLNYCFGCGVCATVCPKKIIDIRLDKEGFYRPFLNEGDACISCMQCDSVCASINKDEEFRQPIGNYAIWSKNEKVRKECSSGGASLEIAKSMLSKGFKFCGVRYVVKSGRAEHYIASNIDEAYDSIGSKYIQSYTVDGFGSIDRKSKYLVVGTPCQIASFRKYIHRLKCEHNFVLMDFFCHSVPSMYLWKFYLNLIKNNIGSIKNIKWRDKELGWHNSWVMTAEGNQNGNHSHCKYTSNFKNGDLFYRLFLGDFCSNRACSESCVYKQNHSMADIRIGDLWGDTFKTDDKGVSGVVAFTTLGKSIIENLTDCEIKQIDNAIVNEGQMKKNIHDATLRPLVISYLKSNNPKASCLRGIVMMQRIINKAKRTIGLNLWL